MPISNRKAYELLHMDRVVIVTCAECGESTWTSDAEYLHGTDEWYCPDCNDDLVEDVFAEMAASIDDG